MMPLCAQTTTTNLTLGNSSARRCKRLSLATAPFPFFVPSLSYPSSHVILPAQSGITILTYPRTNPIIRVLLTGVQS